MPINVTLLFSREHYRAAAEAYLRGIERRIAAGLDPRVESVASLFVSRWDVAANDKVAPEQRNRLGIAIARRTYRAYRELLAAPRWQRLAAAGAHPQRLLWASTGVKDPAARDTLYLEALAAPDTVNTVPEKTLKAFADHGQVAGACPSTAATPRRCSPSCAPEASTTPRSPSGCSAKAPPRSPSRGRRCWPASRPRSSSSRRLGAEQPRSAGVPR